jgi:serine/threonine-protein kinase HipA
MMMFDPKTLHALAVELYGRRIGVINRLAGDRYLFAFERDYEEDANRPTLSLSFKVQSGGLFVETRPVSVRLPPFFSNLLPEGHLRSYLAERAGVKEQCEFFLLAALGADLPGALIVTPHDHDADDHHHRADEAHEKREQDKTLRFSLAGVQLKFSAVMEASGGLTIRADGQGGSWIVKLPSARFAAVPENEHVMLELARAIGITVPENRLVKIKEIEGFPQDTGRMEGRALAVQRFDRAPGGERIHMEDFAQVFGLFPVDKYHRKSYANIASVLWAEAGQDDTYEFVRRLAFTVLIGNADMHLKNWSLLYPDRRRPVLSPAYDFVATLPYLASDELALNFGGSRRRDGITTDQVRHFADTARLPASPVRQIVTETAERTVAAWKKLPHTDVLPRDMKSAIGKQIHTVAAAIAGARP